MTEPMTMKNEWMNQNLFSPQAQIPFSFTYGGQPSPALLPSWKIKTSSAPLDANRTEHILVWTDAQTGLEVRCRVVHYSDFPVVEWTVYLKNTGKTETPILSDIQGMDVSFQKQAKDPFVLRTIHGDNYSMATYQPILVNLGDGAHHQFRPDGGRPTDTAFPYYNIAWDGRGIMAVLGWPGQWLAQFDCDRPQTLRIRGGQELTNLKLRPGEEIRTPLSVLLFWKGEATLAHNAWRRWFIAHNMPRPGGKLIEPQISAAANDWSPGLCGNAATETGFIKTFAQHDIHFDFWWTDAGWYPCDENWFNTGTWEVDQTRYPKGMREVADCAHAHGVKYIVWFEPERVMPDTWLDREHPEWLLKIEGEKIRLLDFGNPAARQWMTDHVDQFLTDEHIDMYRQDFNMGPLPYWRANDKPDRQGITENFHVQGYLAYWDELQRRHPGMPIDSCASGGRRNDLETMRRGIPISKSDLTCDPLVVQSQLYGIAHWLPYFGSGAGLDFGDEYRFRSNISPWVGTGYHALTGNLDYEALRQRLQLWRHVTAYFNGDYYPLTPYSQAQDTWMVVQFNRPEHNDGLIFVFHRPQSPYESAQFKLHDLNPTATYTIANLDTPDKVTKLTGQALIETGLPIQSTQAPDAFFLMYKTKK
jgi:alpha-galactosidase